MDIIKVAFLAGMKEGAKGLEKEAAPASSIDAVKKILNITDGNLYHVTDSLSKKKILDEGQGLLPGGSRSSSYGDVTDFGARPASQRGAREAADVPGEGMGTGYSKEVIENSQDAAVRNIREEQNLGNHVYLTGNPRLYTGELGSTVIPVKMRGAVEDLQPKWDVTDAAGMSGRRVGERPDRFLDEATIPSFAVDEGLGTSYLQQPTDVSGEKIEQVMDLF